MNSYQNKNEYEILDASRNNSNMSNHYPRYPLANDTQASMQNTNYKDWLTMCDSNTQFVGDISKYSSLEAYASAKASIGFGVGLVSTILGIFSGPISLVIGAIIGVTTAVLDFLPSGKDSGNYREIWNDLIEHVKELINDAIETNALNTAKSILDGLSDLMQEYESKLAAWKNSNQSRDLNSDMVNLFISTNNIFLARIPEFQNLGHQVSFLPLFAVAANFHLLLLRDASVYGELWDMSPEFISDYYSGKQGQLNKTKEYTDYAMRVYKEGLEQSKKVSVSNSNNLNWENYNKYRRDMTLTVLDVIALFPTYDNHIYNMSTKVELTRDVYTDLISYIKNPFLINPVQGGRFEGYTSDQFTAIEKALIRPPHLFTWLRELTGYFYQQVGQSQFMTAIQNKYYYTFSNSTIIGPIHGPRYSGDHSISVPLTDYQEIYSTLSTIISLRTNDPVKELTLGSAFYYGVLGHYHDITDRRTGNKTQKILGEGITRGRATVPSVRSEIPYKEDIPPTAEKYSHRLSYISAYATDCGAIHVVRGPGCYRTPQLCAWTHNSVDPTNTLDPNKITQIPAVKAYSLYDNILNGSSYVIKGPNHTGGDLIHFFRPKSGNYLGQGGQIRLNFNNTTQGQSYRIRFRYAANKDAFFALTLYPVSWDVDPFVELKQTYSGNNHNDLKYEYFQYAELPVITPQLPNAEIKMVLDQVANSFESDVNVILDKIEFIPIDESLEEYEGKHQLEKAKKAVNALFTNDAKKALKIDTTDYEVDQAANLVECVSDERYAKEKMILLDEVKYAKQLSQSRNLIQNGDFESADIGWTTSNTITIQADNPIFKGKYLNMPGARNINGAVFPTYAFQKVDESRLKPYTRYKVRGFVGSSKDVEVVVTRYGEEVDTIMNVLNDLTYDVGSVKSCGEWDRCEQQLYQNRTQVLNNSMIIANTSSVSNSCKYVPEKKHVMCPESHQFSFNIDTGEIDMNGNLGISVLFKISSPEGYATLDNIELIEEGSLVGESLAYVQNREKRWKNKMQAERMETQQAYNIAKQVVDILFTDPQDTALRFETNKSNIISADELVQSIPYIYNDWLRDVPGMNYNMFTELKGRITQAYYLYDDRNVLQNGDFNNGLTSWYVTGNAEVQQIDGTFVLVLQNWSTTVSQNVCLQHNRGYVLRVTARKEGMGNGYVTMSDCANHIEKIAFTSCDNNIVGTSTDSAEYVTRTVSFFPDTDHVRIEIGETEGTFKVESVELICMEGKE